MKAKLIFSLLLLLIVSGTLQAQIKHALIFSIGDYPEEGGWGKISSAQDVGYIKKTLLKQGFSDQSIKVVQDSAATKAGIQQALKDLVANVKKNDIVVIHFSSHGEQVADDNGDEVDGYDETIVAYDAKLSTNKDAIARGTVTKEEYEQLQVNYFRDDEFGAYVQQLRSKLGKDGDVVVFMDNCHSGTGTRGSAKTRGGKPALKYEGYQPTINKNKIDEVFKEGTTTRGNESDLASYVVISAALASELNYETTDDDNVSMGSLTYAISKVFENLSQETTYRTLFAKIQGVMNEKVPGQHPVLEGNGLDRSLFGGKFINQKPYVEVEKISSPLMIMVKGGSFAGLNVGAKVKVYPAGTTDPANAVSLANGEVTKATNYSATIKLDKDTKVLQPSLLYVFIIQPVFNVKPIGVVLAAQTRGANSYTPAEADKITTALKKLPLVSLVAKPELIIEKGIGEDTIKIANNGYVFATLSSASDTLELKKTISRYAQYQFLQQLVVKDSTIMAQVKLVLIKNGKVDEQFMNANYTEINYEFADGDTILLWVKNPGKKAVYVNILDLQPDGRINTFLPNKEHQIYPSDLKIEPGQTRTFPDYNVVIGPPYGMEMFKIFVTTKEINLEGLATPVENQSTKRGNLGMLEGLVDESSKTATRGPKVVSVKEAEGSVYNLLFKIKDIR